MEERAIGAGGEEAAGDSGGGVFKGIEEGGKWGGGMGERWRAGGRGAVVKWREGVATGEAGGEVECDERFAAAGLADEEGELAGWEQERGLRSED